MLFYDVFIYVVVTRRIYVGLKYVHLFMSMTEAIRSLGTVLYHTKERLFVIMEMGDIHSEVSF